MASSDTNFATAGDGCLIAWGEVGVADAEHTVLLVHGVTESAETWAPIIERLATNHRIIWMDLRGHGQSGTADDYGLAVMTGDVVAVTTAAGLERPHLVGHSLGGAVVSAVGALLPVRSVTNVDQNLQLGSFREQLIAVEDMLRDPGGFPLVITGLFAELMGTMLPAQEVDRLTKNRAFDQEVVLGVWALMFRLETADINDVVEDVIRGYQDNDAPYLSLFGSEPGEDYEPWLNGLIPTNVIETWDGFGHYPHLVDPDRFVERLVSFWASL